MAFNWVIAEHIIRIYSAIMLWHKKFRYFRSENEIKMKWFPIRPEIRLKSAIHGIHTKLLNLGLYMAPSLILIFKSISRSAVHSENNLHLFFLIAVKEKNSDHLSIWFDAVFVRPKTGSLCWHNWCAKRHSYEIWVMQRSTRLLL